MFSALDTQGTLFSLYRRTTREVAHLKHIKAFYCPECKERVRLRLSDKYAPHFAHLPGNACDRKGETLQHHSGKVLLYEWLRNQNLNPVLEYYIPAINQRPDVYVEWKNRKFAVEFQCSVIPAEKIEQRTVTYREAGIIPIWILADEKVTGDSRRISSSAFLRSFLYVFNLQPVFYTFSPPTKTFSIIYVRQALSSAKWLIRKQSRSLEYLSFTDLFRIRTADKSLRHWLQTVYYYRTTPAPRNFGKENEFRQFLYSKNLSPSLLPSVCFLPVSCQPLYYDISVRWQTKIILAMSSLKQGEKVTCPPVSVSDAIGSRKFNLAEAYMGELADFGYVQKIKEGWYKGKGVPFPKNVEQAVRQDRELMIQLRRKDEWS